MLLLFGLLFGSIILTTIWCGSIPKAVLLFLPRKKIKAAYWHCVGRTIALADMSASLLKVFNVHLSIGFPGIDRQLGSFASMPQRDTLQRKAGGIIEIERLALICFPHQHVFPGQVTELDSVRAFA